VEQIRGHTDTVVLVEGPWDALAITLATNQRAVGVASNGTALSAEHAQHLSAQGRQVVVWTDADDAGRRAARDALDTLTQGGVPVPRYVEVHDLDPSDYQRLFGPAAIRAALLASDPLVCVLADYRLAAVADSGLFAQIEEIRRLGVYTAELGQGDRNLLAGLIQQHTTLAIDSVLAALNEAEPRSLGKALAVARPHPSTSRDSHIAATTRQRLPRLSP
nr:toprim domain-containing protein [Candidatus Nanopelagicales bacterium]